MLPQEAELSATWQDAGAAKAQLAAARSDSSTAAGDFQTRLDAVGAAAERDVALIAALEARLEDTRRRLAAEQARSAEQVGLLILRECVQAVPYSRPQAA